MRRAGHLAPTLVLLAAACSGGEAPATEQPTATQGSDPAAAEPSIEETAEPGEASGAAAPAAEGGEQTAAAAPTVLDADAWRRVSALAPARTVEFMNQRLEALDANARASVVELLGQMEAHGRGAEAIARAGALAQAESGRANDPAWAGSGTQPGTAAVHAGGLAVLAGMVVESIGAEPSEAQSLVDVICAMPLPPLYNSGGRADDSGDRRVLIRALTTALPEDAAQPVRPSDCGSRGG